MAVGGVGQNGVNTHRTNFANLTGEKPKPFNGGTVTVNARAGATQDETIRDALKKFAFQAGIKDPSARAAFAEKWMSRLGGSAARIYAQEGKPVSEETFRRDKADGTVNISLVPGTHDAIINDLRQLQVEKGVINILEANLIREEVTVNAEPEPLDFLPGRSVQESILFDPSQMTQRQLNTRLDDYKYQKQAQDPDLNELTLDITQMGLDVIGIFEPTPFADLTNTGISAVRGNWGDAALSVIGVIPYAGDLAKLGKIPKWLKTIEKISGALDKFADIVRNGGKGAEAVKDFAKNLKDVLNKIPFEKLPDELKEPLEALKKKVDELLEAKPQKVDQPATPLTSNDSYTGTLRGESVTLPNVATRTVEYTKRATDDLKSLRTAFNKVRPEFMKNLADSPEKLAKLREAGFTNADIAKIKKGEVPDGWQVHHKLPLDDGGTNDYSNLVLIKNEPYHKTITNAQRSLVGDLKAGETRTVEFPIPPGNIYPARP